MVLHEFSGETLADIGAAIEDRVDGGGGLFDKSRSAGPEARIADLDFVGV